MPIQLINSLSHGIFIEHLLCAGDQQHLRGQNVSLQQASSLVQRSHIKNRNKFLLNELTEETSDRKDRVPKKQAKKKKYKQHVS